ncbi:MAG: hypothetical protein KKH88_04160 [Nanoarchaeota archaeon]|nr:hypothetical protein [Nanoarchaeota archaeon]
MKTKTLTGIVAGLLAGALAVGGCAIQESPIPKIEIEESNVVVEETPKENIVVQDDNSPLSNLIFIDFPITGPHDLKPSSNNLCQYGPNYENPEDGEEGYSITFIVPPENYEYPIKEWKLATEIYSTKGLGFISISGDKYKKMLEVGCQERTFYSSYEEEASACQGEWWGVIMTSSRYEEQWKAYFDYINNTEINLTTGEKTPIDQEQSDKLFSARRYELYGDAEQNEEERIAFYKLSLNTVLYHGGFDKKQVERLCSKLGDLTGNEIYDELLGDIMGNLKEYRGSLRSFCLDGRKKRTIQSILLPNLSQKEIEQIPCPIRYFRGEHYMYTSLEKIGDTQTTYFDDAFRTGSGIPIDQIPIIDRDRSLPIYLEDGIFSVLGYPRIYQQNPSESQFFTIRLNTKDVENEN